MAWSRIQAEQLGPAVFSVFKCVCALVVPPELPGAPEGTSPRRRGRTRRSACLISIPPPSMSICQFVCPSAGVLRKPSSSLRLRHSTLRQIVCPTRGHVPRCRSQPILAGHGTSAYRRHTHTTEGSRSRPVCIVVVVVATPLNVLMPF